MTIQDRIVMITGGASGIGRIMGEIALKKGASALVIWDINQTNIDATIGEFKMLGKVYGYRVDVHIAHFSLHFGITFGHCFVVRNIHSISVYLS